VVDQETTQYKAVNRSSPGLRGDLLLTMLTAPNVTAVMRPDIPGTYQMLVTVVDACNSTAQALTNVTVLCAHRPAPQLTNGTSGDQPWDQAAAMTEVSEVHSLGWWPSHVLDGSPTYLVDTNEQEYYAYVAADAEQLQRARQAALNMPFPPPGVTAAESPPPAVVVIIAGQPPRTEAPSPPPPGYRPLSSMDEWVQWTTAPRWDKPFRESDGLLYQWVLTGAPQGSQAWRRLFKGVNDTARPQRYSKEGYPFLHSIAPDDGDTPYVNDPRNFVSKFQPDVVGTYGFSLDVSNVCSSASLRFEVSFVCNSVPQPDLRATPRDVNGLCLARQDIASTSVDADGDDVHVLWMPAPLSPDTRDFPDGTPLGARNASYGLLLSDHTGPTTSFMPDVQGEYKIRMTVTDGCLITARDLTVSAEWSADCFALALFASRVLTFGPLGLTLLMLVIAALIARRTPLHPLNPLTVRAAAVRLQRWEAFKLRVKFERLRESWGMKHHRDAFGRALDGGGAPGEFGGLGGKGVGSGGTAGSAEKAGAAAAAQRAFEAGLVAMAVEEGADLLPASVHVWRMAGPLTLHH
jgi:hypothetical protein